MFHIPMKKFCLNFIDNHRILKGLQLEIKKGLGFEPELKTIDQLTTKFNAKKKAPLSESENQKAKGVAAVGRPLQAS